MVKRKLEKIISNIRDTDKTILYVALISVMVLVMGAILVFGPKGYADPSLSLLYLFLGALISLIFSTMQDIKKDKSDSRGVIDRYRQSLISARVVCLDNLVAMRMTEASAESLHRAMIEGAYFNFLPQACKEIEPKNLINNNLFSNIVACNQGLVILSLDDRSLEKYNTEMTHLAHSMRMSKQQISEKVLNDDRSSVKEMASDLIKSLNDRRRVVEILLNEINLHINNLDYDQYIKRPEKMIKVAMSYKPSKSAIRDISKETKDQIETIDALWGYHEIKVSSH